MTANVDIKRGDLHLAVSTAFNRGRYVLMTGGGDGAPIEITIDLRERPDDLFGGEVVDAFDWAGNSSHGRLNAAPPSDDHGPAIPAQDRPLGELLREAIEGEPVAGFRTFTPGPSVYEFALQDAAEYNGLTPTALDAASLSHAPDYPSAVVADWVHVYDRVTRERRTLKRPEPDAVEKGLRDVAADLRGKPVEPPFGCAPRAEILATDDFLDPTPIHGLDLPPVGPLTSTEGLRAGDVVNITGNDVWAAVVKVDRIHEEIVLVTHPTRGPGGFKANEVAFVGRPDADGWMAWAGGENPVPGATVEYRMQGEYVFRDRADVLRWTNEDPDTASSNITAFRIVDTPPAV
jgi:hypothetical protein